jgi:hypothetical protein
MEKISEEISDKKISITYENEHWDADQIKHESLSLGFGEQLIKFLNLMNKAMREKDMKTGYLKFKEMGKFYGNDLEITIRRND